VDSLVYGCKSCYRTGCLYVILRYKSVPEYPAQNKVINTVYAALHIYLDVNQLFHKGNQYNFLAFQHSNSALLDESPEIQWY